MMGSVSKVCKLFEHGKRQDKLLEVIKKELPKVKKKRMKPLCGTRWLDRFDSLKKLLIYILPLYGLSMALHMEKILSPGTE